MTELTIELRAEPQAGQRARAIMAERFADRLAAPSLAALLTVVTELVNNAVQHGPSEPIDVSVRVRNDGSVRGDVTDQGTGRIAMRDITLPSRSGGMGLRIVDARADRWGVYEGSTHVWFEIDAPSA